VPGECLRLLVPLSWVNMETCMAIVAPPLPPLHSIIVADVYMHMLSLLVCCKRSETRSPRHLRRLQLQWQGTLPPLAVQAPRLPATLCCPLTPPSALGWALPLSRH
jgi:hypothetical protein